MFEDKNVLNMLAQYNEVFKDDPATKQEMVITLLCDMGESLFQKGADPLDILPMVQEQAEHYKRLKYIDPVNPELLANRLGERLTELYSKVKPLPEGDPLRIFSRVENDVKSWNDDYTFRLGIRRLDTAFDGVYPGEMLNLAGAQGSLKTSLALHGAVNFLQGNPERRVLFFSLDMSKEETTQRLFMRELEVSTNALHGLIKVNSPRIREAREGMKKHLNRLEVVGEESGQRWTIDRLEKHVALRIPSLVVIDYLTLLKRPGQSDLEAVEEVMPRLKTLTQRLKIRTLILSQLGRASKLDQRKGATGGHAKGGGIVEELVHSEIEIQKDGLDKNGQPRLIATITKARHGTKGSFELEYIGHCMKFTGKSRRVEYATEQKQIFVANGEFGYGL
ncbi:DnaB domain protein helicase domain protein [Aminobacterium colombiense DSM 12261]|uniref:DnaB domain protein helicase domain protein n=2 Tax=Aminobacterium TaxID=81466 RepID=D5EEU2_AMICL|nr:DnaB domain protein helicase domain protein [Aminobacterium colombiense DSM 12261]